MPSKSHVMLVLECSLLFVLIESSMYECVSTYLNFTQCRRYYGSEVRTGLSLSLGGQKKKENV
jgi:hypothetical protein